MQTITCKLNVFEVYSKSFHNSIPSILFKMSNLLHVQSTSASNQSNSSPNKSTFVPNDLLPTIDKVVYTYKLELIPVTNHNIDATLLARTPSLPSVYSAADDRHYFIGSPGLQFAIRGCISPAPPFAWSLAISIDGAPLSRACFNAVDKGFAVCILPGMFIGKPYTDKCSEFRFVKLKQSTNELTANSNETNNSDEANKPSKLDKLAHIGKIRALFSQVLYSPTSLSKPVQNNNTNSTMSNTVQNNVLEVPNTAKFYKFPSLSTEFGEALPMKTNVIVNIKTVRSLQAVSIRYDTLCNLELRKMISINNPMHSKIFEYFEKRNKIENKQKLEELMQEKTMREKQSQEANEKLAEVERKLTQLLQYNQQAAQSLTGQSKESQKELAKEVEEQKIVEEPLNQDEQTLNQEETETALAGLIKVKQESGDLIINKKGADLKEADLSMLQEAGDRKQAVREKKRKQYSTEIEECVIDDESWVDCSECKWVKRVKPIPHNVVACLEVD